MIYKFALKTNKEIVGQIDEISPIFEIEPEKLTREFLDNFKWDRVTECNCPQDHIIVYISNNIDMLRNFRDGFLSAFRVVTMCLNGRQQEQIYKC